MNEEIMDILNEFELYCIEVRNNWSDFDGRSLLNNWLDTKKRLIAEINSDGGKE